LKVFLLPFRFLPFFGPTISDGVSQGNIKRFLVTREVVRGAVMALVAVSIFTLLFSAADQTFENMVDSLFSFDVDINAELLRRCIIFGFVSIFFTTMFGYMLKKIQDKREEQSQIRSMGVLETNILLSSINVVFFAFIILQITTLFGGESYIVSHGLDYAEYATQGFYQLLSVAILSFFIISFTERQIKKNETDHSVSFKILSSLLIIQVIAVLASAFTRLSLYEYAYGFSTIRLYSYALMMWLGIVFLLFAYHILKNERRERFGFKIFCSLILLLVSMNILNPDAFIAKKNMERYVETGKIDAGYLATLSYDAVPYTAVLLEDENEDTRREYAFELFQKTAWGNFNDTNWESLRLLRSRAQEIILPYEKLLEESNNYSLEISDSVTDYNSVIELNEVEE